MKISEKMSLWINRGRIIVFALLIVGSIGFVEKKFNQKVCSSIDVDINNQFENYFISESDVLDIISQKGNHRVVGSRMDEIDLEAIEMDLMKNKFIYNAEVSKDLNGELQVRINQIRPIARMMGSKMADRYISTNGVVLPMSNRYTARVMLIDGAFANDTKLQDLRDTEYGRNLLELMHYIDRDKFWKAQVAQLSIDKKGNITIYTQVSKQKVEFGKPSEIEHKFRNLEIFYKEILPTKGWNYYQQVSVKFRNQIVCE